MTGSRCSSAGIQQRQRRPERERGGPTIAPGLLSVYIAYGDGFLQGKVHSVALSQWMGNVFLGRSLNS